MATNKITKEKGEVKKLNLSVSANMLIKKPHVTEKAKVITEKVAKTATYRGGSSIPHVSVLNLINFFYTKDTLDNLHVM